MSEGSSQRNAARPGLGWSPRNFRFDELDRDTACVPYGEADVELPAKFWGKTLRVEGRLIAPDLHHRPRWQPPARVLALEKRWQKLFDAAGLARWKERLDKWLAVWPRITTPPTLEVSLDGAPLFCHTPAQNNFVAEGTLPPRPDGRETFRLGFRLRNVQPAGFLSGVATYFMSAPMPLALWRRMCDWRFRNLQHRRLRLATLSVDGELVVDFRGHAALPGPAVRKEVRPGLNIVGHFLSEHSMGDAARGSVRAADAAGVPTCLVRLRLPLTSRQSDETVRARLSETMKLPVSLYHINVRETDEIEKHHGEGWMSGRYNIAYWLWETDEFPEDWVRYARWFDEIWTSSRFCAEAIQMSVPVPVVNMPLVVEFAPPAGTNFRAKFGLPEDLFLFLFVFDMNSLAARKNPEAVVEAFRRVAAKNPKAGLVLKTHNVARNAADMERLRARLAGLPNVFVIDRTLARQEVYELMACCDAFVSLHHAEGFGYCVAEAMFLGKPVVSTDWSATAEYVTPQNGFPVRYRMVRLEHHVDEYVRGSEWAEPDVEHAAECMAKLAADPQLCAKLGAQGARDIRERFSAAAVGRRYARRLESILFW
ncbi:MAG: glycosyltransferase family 4 protein [Verrucomicrobia bacterium]|nr:glycosyltransferase family 4 protein [Verrucomicrobiota bacterium]